MGCLIITIYVILVCMFRKWHTFANDRLRAGRILYYHTSKYIFGQWEISVEGFKTYISYKSVRLESHLECDRLQEGLDLCWVWGILNSHRFKSIFCQWETSVEGFKMYISYKTVGLSSTFGVFKKDWVRVRIGEILDSHWSKSIFGHWDTSV